MEQTRLQAPIGTWRCSPPLKLRVEVEVGEVGGVSFKGKSDNFYIGSKKFVSSKLNYLVAKDNFHGKSPE